MEGINIHSLHGGGIIRKLTKEDKTTQKQNLNRMRKESELRQKRLMGIL